MIAGIHFVQWRADWGIKQWNWTRRSNGTSLRQSKPGRFIGASKRFFDQSLPLADCYNIRSIAKETTLKSGECFYNVPIQRNAWNRTFGRNEGRKRGPSNFKTSAQHKPSPSHSEPHTTLKLEVYPVLPYSPPFFKHRYQTSLFPPTTSSKAPILKDFSASLLGCRSRNRLLGSSWNPRCLQLKKLRSPSFGIL